MDDFDLIDFEWDAPAAERTVSGRRLGACISRAYDDNKIDEEQYERLMGKALICHQKMRMMYYGREQAEEVLHDFEITQNMDVPALFGEERTRLLFYTESMILLARTALDVASYVFSHFILNTRKDSFNDFAKTIIKSDRDDISELKDFFEKEGEDNTSAYRLLCGITRGRALRDIVAHQSNVKLEYHEYRENSDKEKLFIVIDKCLYAYDWFLGDFCDDVDHILGNVIANVERNM